MACQMFYLTSIRTWTESIYVKFMIQFASKEAIGDECGE